MWERLFNWLVPREALRLDSLDAHEDETAAIEADPEFYATILRRVNDPARILIPAADVRAAEDEAWRLTGSTLEVEASRVWARAAQARADRGDVTDTTSLMRERLTTLSAVPCTCNPRYQPEHGFVDPNCWACNRGT